MRFALAVLFSLLLAGCSSLGTAPPPSGPWGKRVVGSAETLLGNKPDARVKVRGRVFILDCIGTVRASYWGAGVDLTQDVGKYRGDGVSQLFESLRARSALTAKKVPDPGDIVFWDNTWDANDDGKVGNDGHTHAGIVVLVEPDGTVHYLHESVTRGVVISFLNLNQPDTMQNDQGKVINSPMYLGAAAGKKTNPPHWLSGSLWSGYASVDETVASLGVDPNYQPQ